MNKVLIKGYSQAGEEFLAHQLWRKGIFKVLTTPEDVALHNEMVSEIQSMIGDGQSESLYKFTAKALIIRPKNFLYGIAMHIKNLSLRNSQNENEKKRRN